MDKWRLSENEPNLERMRKRESLWTQGNGYMGIRASNEEMYTQTVRASLINGVFDKSPDDATELVNIPDVVNLEIRADGERFSLTEGRVRDYYAELNMQNGVLTRYIEWEAGSGKIMRINFTRFVSKTRKHIFVQRMSIMPVLGGIDCKIKTGIDAEVTNEGCQHFGSTEKRQYEDSSIGLHTKTLHSNVRVCVHSKIECDADDGSAAYVTRRGIFKEIKTHINEGCSLTLTKLSSFASSRDYEYKDSEAAEERLRNDGLSYLRSAAQAGYDELLRENTSAWKEFWDNCLVITDSGNELVDRAVIFAQYHLNIMSSSDDNRLGVGAKGMTGFGYMGHSFWDTEIFLLPYYMVTEPQKARLLLEYRYSLLDAAKKKAKKYGFKGAMYPWESAWSTDGEVCLEYGDLDPATGKRRKFTMPEEEIHITAGVAYAVWQYYRTTGDAEFMEKYGDEIIILTAIFWTSRVEEVHGRYELLHVTGPDEYKEDVNNNAYTNYMAYYNLKRAAEILEDCPESVYNKLAKEYDMDDVKSKINDTITKLYLPKPDKDGIIKQFDGCTELRETDISRYKKSSKVFTILRDYGFCDILKMQVYKQADLVMLFYLLDEMFDCETIRKNTVFYEKHTLHDSSLSMCIHSLVFAKLKMYDMADKLFYSSCCVDLGDETNNSDTGIHAAAAGGIMLELLYGYGGLRISDDELRLNPVLPQGWREYSFFVNYRGTKLKARVSGGGCSITRISGGEKTVILNGNEITV